MSSNLPNFQRILFHVSTSFLHLYINIVRKYIILCKIISFLLLFEILYILPFFFPHFSSILEKLIQDTRIIYNSFSISRTLLVFAQILINSFFNHLQPYFLWKNNNYFPITRSSLRLIPY